VLPDDASGVVIDIFQGVEADARNGFIRKDLAPGRCLERSYPDDFNPN
jgi:hypothetical protein